jgi:hypothetical protein
MTEIEKILSTGPSARDEDLPGVLPQELAAAEAALGFRFPASYREFALLGGCAELRFKNRTLHPNEIVKNQQYVDATKVVVFGDNGCGDFYCWRRGESGEPSVLFADIDAGTCEPVASSFTAWLSENRF